MGVVFEKFNSGLSSLRVSVGGFAFAEVAEPSLVGSLAYRRGVVDSGRCHCVVVCFGAARGRIRDGHCLVCKSSLRVVDAIECGSMVMPSSTFRDAGLLGSSGSKVPPRAGPIEAKTARPPLSWLLYPRMF